ncbi:hypothetical protein Ahy_A03g014702 [Arachis hypogaea]|uniref:Uncharacterized protein n=1 Tax=Arachis hypogaea TaxID=3818 RepID=A0A445DYD4_ARAHY|nr:hypothetical protein Ahy_A03g014702 [Arachis hypogaea]
MVSVAFPIHRPPIFHVDKIREWNWAKHVLNFLMKGVENKREGNKQSVDGCVFVLMLIYFHETKFPRPFAPDAPPAPWVTYWTREKIIERISSETTQPLTQGSSTPSVDAASNTRKNIPDSPVKYCRKKKIFPRKTKFCLNVTRDTPDLKYKSLSFNNKLVLNLWNSVQEELMKDDFMYVPPQEETQQTPNNDCPQEAEMHGVIVSLTSSVIEGLMKDDYVYEVSNEDPAKEQEQQAQELTVQQESEQEAPVNVPAKEQEQQAQEPPVQQESEQEALPCEEPTEQQSKQEAAVDVCLLEPNKQGVTGSITSSVLEQFFKDADVYQVSDEEQSKEPLVARHLEKETLILSSFDSAAQPRESEDERPSFSLGISSPASQPTQPS